MPHIIVKCLTGKSEEQKRLLAEKLTQAAALIIELGEESFSVSIEEVAPEDWKEKVSVPDIIDTYTACFCIAKEICCT